MNRKALLIYDQLQTDLALCRRKGLGPLKEIECCFHIAERYWAILRQELLQYEFQSERDEIEFFKVIKPQFTSETEYYSLRYHAQLFKEDPLQEDLTDFWKREGRRLEKFKIENRVFAERYTSGFSANDHLCYVRRKGEDHCVSGYDGLVATLLALERYDDYIRKELKLINSQDRDLYNE